MSGTVTSSLQRLQRAQVLGDRVRRVAEALDGFQHADARVGRNDVRPAEHPRNGRRRHPGTLGDFANVRHQHSLRPRALTDVTATTPAITWPAVVPGRTPAGWRSRCCVIPSSRPAGISDTVDSARFAISAFGHGHRLFGILCRPHENVGGVLANDHARDDLAVLHLEHLGLVLIRDHLRRPEDRLEHVALLEAAGDGREVRADVLADAPRRSDGSRRRPSRTIGRPASGEPACSCLF